MTKRPTGDQLISGRPLPFSLETERPAWAVCEELGETDYPALHATPPPAVLRALRSARDRTELWRMLPARL
ncbi:hypothetical protein ACQ9ZG_01975 [Streptomyces araujoniae]|uniref:hypothetical protein n=1 Tax=Streptomyces sp. ZEA17I TaxID=2202516 RepID=UPI0026B92C2C